MYKTEAIVWRKVKTRSGDLLEICRKVLEVECKENEARRQNYLV